MSKRQWTIGYYVLNTFSDVIYATTNLQILGLYLGYKNEKVH